MCKVWGIGREARRGAEKTEGFGGGGGRGVREGRGVGKFMSSEQYILSPFFLHFHTMKYNETNK